ncbi:MULTISPECIES: YckD family protein [Sutcliffiella]|uniref:DUF2680 domain-containing protein n=1 Tax=Sutcliffiella cohnii TaxID=33932 RepID=A0A223KQ88_9BACI|nr:MULTISPECIES: YckD family protein [Sutcliffiella]AST91537.1 hypothetical protein BC6307_09710 [Sutcliffiella cohnii]MED4014892.1 YckD family protein [Sutcliffiella cohnii]WBL17367.1 YckD family protein [Sutcliffiella sp. NC1]
MRKFIFLLSFVVLVVSFAPLSNVQAHFNGEGWINKDVKLTDSQKEELGALHKNVLIEKKNIINKYVEYGIIPPDKGDKIIAKMEKRYKKMEENEFIPQWDKYKKHKKHNE